MRDDMLLCFYLRLLFDVRTPTLITTSPRLVFYLSCLVDPRLPVETSPEPHMDVFAKPCLYACTMMQVSTRDTSSVAHQAAEADTVKSYSKQRPRVILGHGAEDGARTNGHQQIPMTLDGGVQHYMGGGRTGKDATEATG